MSNTKNDKETVIPEKVDQPTYFLKLQKPLKESETFIYASHKESVYVPELKESYEAKVSHSIWDTKTRILNALQNAKTYGVNAFSISAINPRASGLLIQGLNLIMDVDHDLLDGLHIDVGLIRSRYGDVVLNVNFVRDLNGK